MSVVFATYLESPNAFLIMTEITLDNLGVSYDVFLKGDKCKALPKVGGECEVSVIQNICSLLGEFITQTARL